MRKWWIRWRFKRTMKRLNATLIRLSLAMDNCAKQLVEIAPYLTKEYLEED